VVEKKKQTSHVTVIGGDKNKVSWGFCDDGISNKIEK
jgi:hypothetical protein